MPSGPEAAAPATATAQALVSGDGEAGTSSSASSPHFKSASLPAGGGHSAGVALLLLHDAWSRSATAAVGLLVVAGRRRLGGIGGATERPARPGQYRSPAAGLRSCTRRPSLEGDRFAAHPCNTPGKTGYVRYYAHTRNERVTRRCVSPQRERGVGVETTVFFALTRDVPPERRTRSATGHGGSTGSANSIATFATARKAQLAIFLIAPRFRFAKAALKIVKN